MGVLCMVCAPERLCSWAAIHETNMICPRPEQQVNTTSCTQCPIKGLDDVISNLQLHAHASAIYTWCSEAGAAFLDEVAEEVEDLLQQVAFNEYERDRLVCWAAGDNTQVQHSVEHCSADHSYAN